MRNEIINIVQLPIIEEQLLTIKKEIEGRVETALSLECNVDTVKTVKEERAKLNKELKDWDDRRKQVKEAIMLPYNQFDERYKKCISEIYKNSDVALKSKIDGVECAIKDEKMTELKDYFDEYARAKDINFVTFEMAGINITLSASLKALKEQAKAFIDSVESDIKLIGTQENKEEIMVEYRKNFNVASAITTVKERHLAVEELKILDEQLNKKQEEKAKAVEKVEELAPPIVEEEILTVKFAVKGTVTQLKALKEFLKNNNYIYENLK